MNKKDRDDTRFFGYALDRWGSNDEWRFYHTVDDHLFPMMDSLPVLDVSSEEHDLMVTAALFHDIVYDVRRTDNEEASAEEFIKQAEGSYLTTNQIEKIVNLILVTRLDHYESIEEGSLEEKFVLADLNSLRSNDRRYLIDIEKKIQREYQFVDWTDYKEGKKKVFDFISGRFPELKENTDFVLDFVLNQKPKIGVYAGTFDPFHVGHLNILKKAEKIFDKVIVLSGINREKENSIDSIREKLRETLRYHQVESWDEFLPDFIRSKSYSEDITLIRGLRTDTDFKKEEIQLRFFQDYCPELKVVFIPCDKSYEHISSSSVKILDSFGKNTNRYILDSKNIYEKLREE